MYGLVNRAIEQLVVSLRGNSGWRGVCAHANVSPDGFVAMEQYDDSVTYDLVQSVSHRLGLDPHAVLEAFGEYWITYTAHEGYGHLIAMGGSDLREFLGNLDAMHARVETAFPSMRIPQFRVEDVSDDEFLLHYASTREGLAPMVIGLVKGLGKRFGQVVEIVLETPRATIHEEDIFRVKAYALATTGVEA